MICFRMVLVGSVLIFTSACVTAPAPQSVDESNAATVAKTEEVSVVKDGSADPEGSVVATNDAEVDGSRVICKRTIVTGSRFSKNTCKTWDEWQALQRDSRDGLNRTQRLGTVGTPDALGR